MNKVTTYLAAAIAGAAPVAASVWYFNKQAEPQVATVTRISQPTLDARLAASIERSVAGDADVLRQQAIRLKQENERLAQERKAVETEAASLQQKVQQTESLLRVVNDERDSLVKQTHLLHGRMISVQGDKSQLETQLFFAGQDAALNVERLAKFMYTAEAQDQNVERLLAYIKRKGHRLPADLLVPSTVPPVPANKPKPVLEAANLPPAEPDITPMLTKGAVPQRMAPLFVPIYSGVKP